MFCRRLTLFIRQHIPTADVFYDESQLMAGDDWVQLIPRQVVDRHIFIVVLSTHSVEANWVREETQIALREAMNNPGRSVIPVLYQDCDIDRLSPLLKSRQLVICTQGRELAGFASIVKALSTSG